MSIDDRHLSLHGYDFGDEGDIPLPDDPAFDAWVAKVAPAVNAPPDTPRAAMWDDIAARIPQAAAVHTDASVRPLRRSRFFLPLAVAAALMLGIAIDRVVQRTNSKTSAAPTIATTTPGPTVGPRDSANPARLYRLAAQQTLSQAEALLTAYRATDVATRDPQAVRQLAQWGRQVLSSTRLLIDSPAGDDPRLKPLLEDLEVVLAQIIQLSGATLDQSERDLIDGAIRRRDLLLRIRSAVPSGASDASTE